MLLKSSLQKALGQPTNLHGRALPPVGQSNLKALLERPYTKPGYQPRSIKAQNQQFQGLLRQNAFFGAVDVHVSDCPSLTMLNMNDDQVASIYFYFGPDAYESLSVYLFAQLAKEETTVFDVGAYTGLFGLLAARVNPRAAVICVEPIPATAHRVTVNAELNGLINLQVVQGAVSDTVGSQKLTLYGVSTATTGASLLNKSNLRNSAGEIEVTTMTLDQMAQEAGGTIGLMKIDTEGAEVKVFKAGHSVLKDHRPIILSEVLSNDAVAEQSAALKPYGYSGLYVDEVQRQLIPVNDSFSLKHYGNIIFCAAEDDMMRVKAIARRFAGYPHAMDH